MTLVDAAPPGRWLGEVSERRSTDLTCPPTRDAAKPPVMLLHSKDHLSFPSDSGNR